MPKVIHQHLQTLKYFSPLLGMAALTVLSAFVLSSPRSSAETRKLNAAVHVPDTCSMNAVDSGTATVDNPYEMIGGMYVDNISSTTINITCNDRNGYSLYAVGYGNGDVGNTNMIGHESGNIIPTGTVSDGSVSNWSFRLTPISGVYTPSILSDTNGSFTTNHVIPSANTKIATFTGDIDASAESSLTATYAVGVEHYQTPDIYTGQVRYTLVHPNYTNADGTTESYAGPLTFTNASSMTIDGVTYTSSSEAPDLTHGEHTISAGTFPTGYEFGSWSATGGISITDPTSATATINVISAGTLSLNGKLKTFTVTIATNNATSVNIDGATYSSGATPSLTYGTHTISGTYPSGYEFGSWSSTGSISIASASTASTTMTVNGAGTLTLNAKQSCTSSLSGIMQNWTTPASSVCASATGTMTDNRSGNKQYTVAKIGNLIWMTRNLDLPGGTTLSQSDSNLNGSTTSYTLRASSTSGFNDYTTGWVYNSGRTTCSNNSSTGSCYSYYSYAAATAGTNPSSGVASSDICPYGWRLPTYSEMSGITSSVSSFSPVYSGIYVDSTFYNGGSYGFWWSSTARDAVYAYNLVYYNGSLHTDYYSKNYGSSIRCVAKS